MIVENEIKNCREIKFKDILEFIIKFKKIYNLVIIPKINI